MEGPISLQGFPTQAARSNAPPRFFSTACTAFSNDFLLGGKLPSVQTTWHEPISDTLSTRSIVGRSSSANFEHNKEWRMKSLIREIEGAITHQYKRMVWPGGYGYIQYMNNGLNLLCPRKDMVAILVCGSPSFRRVWWDACTHVCE